MSHPSLKSILNKRTELTAWLQSYIESADTEIVIYDINNNILFGKASMPLFESFPIICQEETLGWVNGNKQAKVISDLLMMLLQKEVEKKKLGSEVLNLYQELNVIYNFSEKLTQTIDPEVIAQATLEQAIHSIPSESGVILLWDESSKQIMIPARAGESLLNESQLKNNAILLFKMGMSGQSEIMSDISVLKANEIITEETHSVIYAAMKVKHRIMGAIILAGKKADQYSAAHLKLLVTLALQSSTAIESAMLYEKNIREAREREEAIRNIHETTKKFVPIEFIRALGKESLTDVKLGDQVNKIITVLFTDIRDFTPLSEKMSPEENFRFVSSFNERLGPIIKSHNGFINQYLGDSIMALFPENPEDALKAAIEMQQAVATFNRERFAEGLVPIKAGIGLHTGPLIMGITGDEYRLDAATISDTVNTASRIESLTKYYQSPLLLSGDTLKMIGDPEKYHLRHLGKVQLKGKNNLLSIVECINGYPQGELHRKIKTLAYFNQAMEYYLDQRFEKAINVFQNILVLDPEDHAAEYFSHIANNYLLSGVPVNWTGAEAMANK